LSTRRSAFTSRERARLALEILHDYVRVRLQMRRGGLRETVAALRAPARTAGPVETADATRLAINLGAAVGRVCDVLPTDSRCLIRSLVLTRVLARRGLDSALVIGVRSEPSFEAHAWLERDGVPLLPPHEQEFSRLVEI